MLNSDAGQVFRSKGDAWSTGKKFNVDLSFLDEARDMAYPEITELRVHFEGSVTTAGGTTFNAEDGCRLIANVQVRDGKEDRVNVQGTSLRAIDQIMYGDAFTDPAQQGAASTDTDYDMWLRVPFSPIKARSRSDFHVPLSDLINGGKIFLSLCTTNPVANVTVNSGTVYVYARVVDGRKPRAKSRLSWLEQATTLREERFPIGGSLYTAFMIAPNDGAASYQSWTGANYDEITSLTLRYTALKREYLVDDYQAESHPESSDVLIAGKALPLVTPRRDQKIGGLLDVRTLHTKLGAAPPSNSYLVYGVVTDRNPELAARAAGYGSVEHYAAAVKATGRVKSPKGSHKPATGFAPTLAKRLPIDF